MRALLLIAAPLTLVACADGSPTAEPEETGYTDEVVVDELDTPLPPEPGENAGAETIEESEQPRGEVQATQPVDSAESGNMPEPL